MELKKEAVVRERDYSPSEFGRPIQEKIHLEQFMYSQYGEVDDVWFTMFLKRVFGKINIPIREMSITTKQYYSPERTLVIGDFTFEKDAETYLPQVKACWKRAMEDAEFFYSIMGYYLYKPTRKGEK